MKNMRAEGIASERVFFVGNTMIDSLHAHEAKADRSGVLQRFSLDRMVSSYVALYDELLHGRTAAPAQVGARG